MTKQLSEKELATQWGALQQKKYRERIGDKEYKKVMKQRSVKGLKARWGKKISTGDDLHDSE